MNFKKYLCLLLSFMVYHAYSQTANQSYKLIGDNIIQTKNYYLLTLFQNNAAAKQLLANDPELTKLTQPGWIISNRHLLPVKIHYVLHKPEIWR
jgi:hypothetical protein